MSHSHIISLITFLPLVGGLVLLAMGRPSARIARGVALLFSLAGLVVAAFLWTRFDPTVTDLQFVERYSWIPSIGVQYFVGIDGLSLLMVLLTAIVTPMAILASEPVGDRPNLYFAMVLFLQAGLFGTFTALNFFHWFFFWELSLIPAFFLIKLWGGPERNAAATQFFMYTMVGSVTMLLSFLALYRVAGTFDFLELAEKGRSGELVALMNVKLGWYFLSREQLPLVIFGGVFLGFAVKVPVVPFHTWLPQTYAEAPTGTTMLLTGVMSKMGVYGFLRILLPIFPDQMRWVLTPLLWLAVATIILSACSAFAQRDLKRIFAYSSINHLGYCLLGMFAFLKPVTGADFPWNIEKAAALSAAHLAANVQSTGLTAFALFCFIAFLERRSGGLRRPRKRFRRSAQSCARLLRPDGHLNFRVARPPRSQRLHRRISLSSGRSSPLATWATALSVIGLLVTAIFLLTVIQRVFNGPLNQKWSGFPDLTWRERLIVIPATALMFLIGIYPQVIIGKINATVMLLVDQLKF